MADRIGLRVGVLAVLCAAAVGCASHPKVHDVELGELATWFPGWYDNRDQVETERAGGRTVHEAVTLSIVPIYAPVLSNTVFYLHENASGDVRRVLSQRLAAFSVTRDGKIIERTYTFVEPTRWRDGVRNTDLFKSLVVEDLHEVTGCELTWHKSGERFSGMNDPAKCRTPTLGGGAILSVKSTAELTASELDIDQRVIGADGSETAAVPADFHFKRRTEAPAFQ